LNNVVIIPALNEEAAIGGVVESIRDRVDRVIVVDNGSTDKTAEIARLAGAETLFVPELGYGRACLAGIAAAPEADILIFMDGDGADDPDDLERLLTPIREDQVDFILGSRLLGPIQKGSLTLPQILGNSLATFLMRVFWKARFSDLGPFRAIRRSSFETLNMQAPTYGWTIEMQIRALKAELRYTEIPVNYRRRVGKSKISGTVKGVVLAGTFIIGTVFREVLQGSASLKP
jgi:glycosyltransferase involved in cell wall biosynthesis